MLGLPTLQSIEEKLAHLQRLNEGVKEETGHSRAMIQGLRDRPDPTRGSTAGLELGQFERRVRDAISEFQTTYKQPHKPFRTATYPDIQNAQAQVFIQLPSRDVELRLGTMDNARKNLQDMRRYGPKLFGTGAHVFT